MDGTPGHCAPYGETVCPTLAAERAHSRAWLHDHVLQFLEYIAAGGWAEDVDPALLVRAAAIAAADLRAYVEGQPHESPDLRAALTEAVVAAQLMAGDLDIALVTAPLPARIDPAVVEALGGAVREALTNVCRHAHAQRVSVTCSWAPTGARVRIEDDGVGFDPEVACDGLGIRGSIVERMREIGGSAEIESAPGCGTTVTLRAGLWAGEPLERVHLGAA